MDLDTLTVSELTKSVSSGGIIIAVLIMYIKTISWLASFSPYIIRILDKIDRLLEMKIKLMEDEHER